MICATWNVRGLHKPQKQAAVRELVRNKKVDLLGLVETKLSFSSLRILLSNHFAGWNVINNFDLVPGGRILLLWNPAKIDVVTIIREKQVIHTTISCLVTNNSFNFSLVYGFWSVANRRELWDSLLLHTQHNQPLLLAGDFNCVLSEDDRIGNRPPTEYEIKDFVDTTAFLGLEDVPASGAKYTWTDGSIFSKIDRVMVNNHWFEANFLCRAEFTPPGVHSDHSPAIIYLFGEIHSKPRPFKFFNSWTNHAGFIPLLEQNWNVEVRGWAQFKLATCAKMLQSHLKTFNLKEYSDISTRASNARTILETAQKRLDDNPLCYRL